MENKPKSKIRFSMVVRLGGSYCAFMIGAGYATGQEIIQYYTAFGFLQSILGFIVGFILGSWTSAEIMDVGYKSNDIDGRSAYKNLCGKYLGMFLSFFIPIFMFLTFVIMIAGSGATFNQHFGISPWIGAGIMAIVAAVIVFLGLQRVVDTIGFIGPCIIIIAILTGFIILITNPFDIQAYETFIKSDDIAMLKAADNWFMSTILYVLWGIVMGLPFMSAMGSRAISVKEIVWGSLFGNLIFNIALALLSFAMASRITEVWDMSIPALAMADSIHPAFGTVYSIILLIAICTTAIPLLWSVAARITKEKTKAYYIVVAVIAILGFFGGQLPFEMLINYIYPLIGYIGFIVLACIIWKDIKWLRKKFGKNKDTKDTIESKEDIS